MGGEPMSLAPLATLDDIPGVGALSPEDAAAATAGLASASRAVRAWTRQQFVRTQQTTRLRARDRSIILPQRPVISVDALAAIIWGNPVSIPTVGLWDGLDRINLAGYGMVLNLPEAVYEAAALGPLVCDVTYTSGYDEVPEDVVDVVVGLATRSAALPASGVFTGQTAGPYGYTVAPWAQGGPLSLSEADKVILARYRQSTSSVETRSI
jgi:hypothetical protein